MSTAVPLCDELGFKVPARYDEEAKRWVVTCPFPARFDEREKRWLLEEGLISWDQVMVRWKKRGPANEEFVAMVQRGNKGLARLLGEEVA
jgi:ring-1,2-phenylacetyl-CoA epoxidase subunit PaaA